MRGAGAAILCEQRNPRLGTAGAGQTRAHPALLRSAALIPPRTPSEATTVLAFVRGESRMAPFIITALPFPSPRGSAPDLLTGEDG